MGGHRGDHGGWRTSANGRRAGAARAFTLLELLVVVSIVALLLSILVPGVAKARAMAQRAVCLSHQQGIGRGLMLYAAERKNYLPWGNRFIWFQALLPYVRQGAMVTDYRQVGIYRCPSYPVKMQTVCFVASAWAFTDWKDQTGYGFNEPRNLKEFDRPWGTLYLTDNENGPWRQIITKASDPELTRQDVWNPSHLPTSTSTDITYGRRVAATRHYDGCDGLFLDGHATWIKATAMTVNMWRDKWNF